MSWERSLAPAALRREIALAERAVVDELVVAFQGANPIPVGRSGSIIVQLSAMTAVAAPLVVVWSWMVVIFPVVIVSNERI